MSALTTHPKVIALFSLDKCDDNLVLDPPLAHQLLRLQLPQHGLPQRRLDACPVRDERGIAGGIDENEISIDYLSDTVMSIRQTGRSSCGGGAPDDYIDHYTYDASRWA